jgi:hypothetical protein
MLSHYSGLTKSENFKKLRSYKKFIGHKDSVFALAFSTDNKFALTALKIIPLSYGI